MSGPVAGDAEKREDFQTRLERMTVRNEEAAAAAAPRPAGMSPRAKGGLMLAIAGPVLLGGLGYAVVTKPEKFSVLPPVETVEMAEEETEPQILTDRLPQIGR